MPFIKKDEFGRKNISYKNIVLFFVMAVISIWIYTCGCNGSNEISQEEIYEGLDIIDVDDKIKEPPVKTQPVDIKEVTRIKQQQKKQIIGYKYFLVKRFTKKLYVTCYSQHDGPIEKKGVYANQKYADKLHISERRIRRHHYTCALPPELKNYHENLIYLNGKWTHKYRVHISGYNNDDKDDIDRGYWSVPRDRMLQRGRCDALITTAGKYATIQQRLKHWKSNIREVEFWEIVKRPVYRKESK